MVFSSFDFLIKFLPAFLIVYYASVKFLPKARNFVVFLFSMIFYAYGAFKDNHPLYLLLIFASVCVNYFLGRMLNGQKLRKLWLCIGLVFDFSCLFFFKYTDFVFGTSLDLALPIGISFYTFQIASYLIDVYRNPDLSEKNFVNLGAYIMMFPQLIAGPIVRFNEVRKALTQRKESLALFVDGIKIFVLGLGSKVLIANQVGVVWQDIQMMGYDAITCKLAWLGIIAYSLQIYFDFYGYSLMAIGLGKMIGFEFPTNFNAPYTAVSMTDFWRKWHMTLGSWFKEYVYIPLGGNRKGIARTYLNLFIVWMLTGIWHGADWNFVLWGLLLFILIAVEKAGLGDFMEKHRVIGHIYMIILIPLQWAVFAINGFDNIKMFFYCLLGHDGPWAWDADFMQYSPVILGIMLLGIILSSKLPQKLYHKFKNSAIMYIVLAIVLAGSVYCLYMGMNDPFLYFRF